MANNKSIIVKGIKFLGVALPLMLLGPVLLTIGFRAQLDGNYLFLILGILILLIAIVCAFLGVRTIITGLFTKNE